MTQTSKIFAVVFASLFLASFASAQSADSPENSDQNLNLEKNLNLDLNLDLNPETILNDAIGEVKIPSPLDLFNASGLDVPILDLKQFDIGTTRPVRPVQTNLPEIDLKQFMDIQNIESDNLLDALKEVAIFAINIFIVVITVVAQILKGLVSLIS